MLRRATLVLLVAAALAPATSTGSRSHSPVASTPDPSAQRVVVRTEVVPASRDSFDWLDAAAGFGLATASLGVVLLILAGRRPRAGCAKT